MEPRIVFLKPKSIDNINQQKGSTFVYLNREKDVLKASRISVNSGNWNVLQNAILWEWILFILLQRIDIYFSFVIIYCY